MAGYSGTPLPKKLGIKEGHRGLVRRGMTRIVASGMLLVACGPSEETEPPPDVLVARLEEMPAVWWDAKRARTKKALVLQGSRAVPALIGSIARTGLDFNKMLAAIPECVVAMGPSAFPALLKELEHREPLRRAAAAYVFRKFGPHARSAAGAVATRLSDPDPLVRRHCLRALAAMEELTTGHITRRLADPDDAVRLWAMAEAKAIGSRARACEPAIRALLKDTGPEIRSLAAVAVWHITNDACDLIPVLAGALHELYSSRDDWDELWPSGPPLYVEWWRTCGFREGVETVAAMHAAGGDATTALMRFVKWRNEDVVSVSALALATKGGDGVAEALIGALPMPAERSISGVFTALATLGPAARGALPILRRLLVEGTYHDRQLAAGAIVAIEEHSTKATRAVLLALRTPIEKSNLLRGVAQAKPGLAELLLSAALKDTRATVRLETVRILAYLHEVELDVAQTLDAALDDPDWKVRVSAARALLILGTKGESALASVLARLNDPRREVRSAMFAALPGMTNDASRAVRVLIPLLKTERIRRDTVIALGQFGRAAAAATPRLIEFLGDRDDNLLRAEAALALGRVSKDAEQVAPHLATALWDPDLYVTQKAAAGLRVLGPLGLAQLIESYQRRPPSRLAILRNLAPDSRPEILPVLVDAAGDGNPHMRAAAIAALIRSGDSAVRAIKEARSNSESDRSAHLDTALSEVNAGIALAIQQESDAAVFAWFAKRLARFQAQSDR
ncbi:MAG: HEAT repeat domain-containing protein [Planctomycetota bacterium]